MAKTITLLADVWGYGCLGDVIAVDSDQFDHLKKLQDRSPEGVKLYKEGEHTDVDHPVTAEEAAREASRNNEPAHVADVDLTKTETDNVDVPVAPQAVVDPAPAADKPAATAKKK
ncbi:hypothetical protein [Williamsia sterculiae]|uniref:Uncharacterized protein n=1 Tax=Williamsia sterculiae TaxID=1344003 RepID=A0A1N7GFP6_9NOCA|nr:hypothetical protein [Williamsia sterculiae]SIS11394.1 hypothetical protein SAMN05445060_2732 [Williamsia sterculiae]